MAPNKTQPTTAAVSQFLNQLTPEKKRQDANRIYQLMQSITGCEGVIWGTCIIGFGNYTYRYKSGRTGEWFLCGFSPRKHALTLYLTCDVSHQSLDFSTLGPHKKGKGCLYLKALEKIDFEVLKKLIEQSIALTASRKEN